MIKALRAGVSMHPLDTKSISLFTFVKHSCLCLHCTISILKHESRYVKLIFHEASISFTMAPKHQMCYNGPRASNVLLGSIIFSDTPITFIKKTKSTLTFGPVHIFCQNHCLFLLQHRLYTAVLCPAMSQEDVYYRIPNL